VAIKACEYERGENRAKNHRLRLSHYSGHATLEEGVQVDFLRNT
jgi:hypothetical protein